MKQENEIKAINYTYIIQIGISKQANSSSLDGEQQRNK